MDVACPYSCAQRIRASISAGLNINLVSLVLLPATWFSIIPLLFWWVSGNAVLPTCSQ